MKQFEEDNRQALPANPRFDQFVAAKQLDHLDRVLLKYSVEHPQLDAVKLSKITGIGVKMIRTRRSEPLFQLELQKLSRTTDTLLEEAAKKATLRIIDLIEHQDPEIAIAACKLALTRKMHELPENTQRRVIAYQTSISPDGALLQDIVYEEIKGHIIDVEPTIIKE